MRNVLKTKTLVSFIALIIISCSSNDERESILIGSTFKVEEIENFQSDVDIVYQWWVGNKPEGSDFMFRVNGDKAFLTPDIQNEKKPMINKETRIPTSINKLMKNAA